MKVQKIIKEREDSLKEAYQKVLEVGLGNKSIDDLSSFIEQDVMGYGTARDEKIRSIAEFIELIQLQRKQSINFDDFHYTSKPVLIRFTDNSYTAVVVDEIELVSVIGNDSNKLDLRMTSVFNFIDGSWKLIHWHGSTAEHVSDGGDPWHVNEWKKKTEKLEQMVEEKTAELIERNKELEIEASLERVRAVAMGMHKSDDLIGICEVSFKEFQRLGFDQIRNAIIHIPNDEQKYFWDYDYSELTGGAITKIEYDSHPIVADYVKKIRSAEDAYFEVVITNDQLAGWKEFRKNSGQYDDPRLNDATALYYYLFSIGIGDIGISTFEPIDDTQIRILKRFRNVFDLAYRRYNDITIAEEQAKEAQIEAALERVRSRTMGMQKSEELKEVIQIVYDQIVQLKIHTEHTGFIMDYKSRDDYNSWIADRFGTPSQVTIPYFDCTYYTRFNDAKEKGLDFFAITLSFEEKNRFYHDLFQHIPGFPEESKKTIFEAPAFTISTVLLENVALYIENFAGVPYSKEENEVLMRFGKVFQQTYTRFLDLQKAEAQARESKIELSLERIRAQVTAMRESSELLDIVVTMRSEFVALGHEAHYFWHMRWLPHRYDKAMTSGDGTRIGMVMTLPRHIHGDVKLVADWEKSDEPTLVFAMDVDTAVDYVEKMITLGDFQQIDPQAPTLDDIRHIGGLTFIMARTTHGEIGFSLPGTVPNPPEESVTTLARFAGVFDLAYRRFEDLKEAEEKNKIIQAENDRKTKELEDARQLQLSMLPKELPQIQNLDIAVYMKTATEVGGDYYDFNVDANGTLTVLVGDATGHGMMSGMMVSIMKSFFISNKANIELKQFFENSNNSIKDMQLGRLMMGLIGIQITTEKLIATNAGMPSLLYFRNKSQKAGEFVSNNLPLGGMKGTSYLLKTVRYEKGDTILLMSDGFAELRNSHNEQYGYVRIKEKFRSLVHKSSNEIIEELKITASQWTNGAEPDDDVTFVVIKVK